MIRWFRGLRFKMAVANALAIRREVCGATPEDLRIVMQYLKIGRYRETD
jgi:hypothetical protein